jgi:hypothetical protein
MGNEPNWLVGHFNIFSEAASDVLVAESLKDDRHKLERRKTYVL